MALGESLYVSELQFLICKIKAPVPDHRMAQFFKSTGDDRDKRILQIVKNFGNSNYYKLSGLEISRVLSEPDNHNNHLIEY